MPTYQRLIKKDRLVSIKNFINNGGFFPNSIIIDIDTKGQDLQFDFADKRIESSDTRIGILHLPQIYRTAYIIDGQHDIVDHLVMQKTLSPTTDKVDSMIEKVSCYLQPLIAYYKSITPKERDALKKKRGSGGPGDYWHILQQAVNNEFADFNPPGLDEWIFLNKHVYNDEALRMLQQISEDIRDDVRKRLVGYFGDSWFTQGLPKSVYDKTTKAANDYNYANGVLGLKKEAWDFITLADCKNIVTKSGNWAEVFENTYSDPKYGKTKAKKGDKAEWLNKLSRIFSQNFETYSVTEEEYKTVSDVYNWITSNRIAS